MAWGDPDDPIRFQYHRYTATDHNTVLWVMGHNTPSKIVKFENALVPNGKLTKSKETGLTLLYDEYIVYDQMQISQQYLVLVKQ